MAKLWFSVVLKQFGEYSQRTSLFRQKSEYLWKENWNTQVVCFSYHVRKGANPDENLDCLNNIFYQISKSRHILTKNVFLPKECHILLNYAFLFFEAIWGIITENFSFSQKSDYLWKENWKTQAVCFSYHVWKGENPEENLDLFKQLLLIKPVKGENI